MGLVCLIVGHKWHKLPDGEEGCSCSRCGKSNVAWVVKHNMHKEPGSCKATCLWCGKEAVRHEWNGCKCNWCGEVQDFDHEWQSVPGTCDLKCAVCGKVNEYIKEHEWEGCVCARCGACRNEGHVFAPTEDGKLVCSVCGISADESRAKSAKEILEQARRSSDRDGEELFQKANDLIRQISNPADVAAVAPLSPYCAIERLAELGADEELARIARSDGDDFSYKAKCEARSLIKDSALRDSIIPQRTGMEAIWYDYDIKSGM